MRNAPSGNGRCRKGLFRRRRHPYVNSESRALPWHEWARQRRSVSGRRKISFVVSSLTLRTDVHRVQIPAKNASVWLSLRGYTGAASSPAGFSFSARRHPPLRQRMIDDMTARRVKEKPRGCRSAPVLPCRLLTKELSGLELSGLSLTPRTTFATGGVAGESPPTSQGLQDHRRFPRRQSRRNPAIFKMRGFMRPAAEMWRPIGFQLRR